MPTAIKSIISEKPTSAIMIVFKTEGTTNNNIDFMNIQINNNSYVVVLKTSQYANKNILSFEQILNNVNVPTNGTETKMYINGIESALDKAEILTNQWTALIVSFLNPQSSNSTNHIEILGNTTTNVSIIASYTVSENNLRESIVYKYWSGISNITWGGVKNTYGYVWKDIYGIINQISAISEDNSYNRTNSIWDTFLGKTRTISPQTLKITLSDILPIKMGKYRYQSYLDNVVVENIVKSPR